jgi:uncharacterized protein (DUF1800 family)
MADPRSVAHLLRRATFGPTAAEVEVATRAGYDATLAGLLAPAGVDPGASATPQPDLGVDPYSTLMPGATPQERQAARKIAQEQALTLGTWWVRRMIAAEHQLVEKLGFFWHGHWATSVEKVRSATLMARQLDTMRRTGRGDFAVMVKAMLRDPALILWLDGEENTRQAPNENLAREVMELFTLGIGSYGEADVKAGARVLTGWVIDRHTGAASLEPRRHDDAPVTLLGQTRAFDVDSYADLLVAQPANAEFIARRLWFRFASSDPIPAATQERVAAVYRPGRDITAALRAVFVDEEFPRTQGNLVKQPIEWIVGAVRQLGLSPTIVDTARDGLVHGLSALGQVPLRPPSVGGWPAGAAWLTTSAAETRIRLATALANQVPAAVLAPLGTGPASARADALARLLVVDGWSGRTRDALGKAGDPRHLLVVGLVSPEYTVV